MKVHELMTGGVETVHGEDSLASAARIMWERDCGAVPVVDAEGKLSGIVTDRDACIAAYTQGRSLDQIPVSVAASKLVFAVRPEDSVEMAEDMMRRMQVRRLPVVDGTSRIVGLLSLADLALHVHRAGRRGDGLSNASVAATLAAVSRPHAASEPEVPEAEHVHTHPVAQTHVRPPPRARARV
jgi:CBS domain-containing protein